MVGFQLGDSVERCAFRRFVSIEDPLSRILAMDLTLGVPWGT